MDRLHAARKASWKSPESERFIKQAVTCLAALLPPVHELREDMSNERSQSTTRTFGYTVSDTVS